MLRLVIRSIGLLLAMAMLGGCLSPHTTRLPSLGFQNSEVEKRSYELHDPYPDELSGPETITRPRSFSKQRTENRRTFEQKMFEGNGIPQGTAAPRLPSAQWKYPDAIRE